MTRIHLFHFDRPSTLGGEDVKRRESDGRTPEHGYTISFSAQADLKRLSNACIFFSFKDVV